MLWSAPRPLGNKGLQPNGMRQDGTTVCRCEEVTAGDIRSCIGAGSSSVKAIKDWTRAGMGPCQGRICRTLVAQIIADASSIDVGSVRRSRIRPPFKPVPFEAMAQSE